MAARIIVRLDFSSMPEAPESLRCIWQVYDIFGLLDHARYGRSKKSNP